jgi:dihydropteroate synthase
MRIYQISIQKDKKEFLRELGVDSGGVEIIAKKMDTLFFKIEKLKTPAANILKQEALALGAELAVPAGVIICKEESVDALLIITQSKIKPLTKKLSSQPFGLKEVAKKLQEFLSIKTFPLKIMGVINANSDSFYSGSRFREREAIEKIYQMVEDGADIIDIGGVSSRPGSVGVSVEEELRRLKPICDAIKREKIFERVTFSIDSYTPEVIEYALKSGFSIINDITGARDERVIKLAKEYQVKLSIMHMQGTPQTMQQNPKYESVVDEVDNFFEAQIKKAQELGLSKSNIILDVGIGFGKSLKHNLELLNSHSHFQHFGCELLIGASRKSLIDKITPTPVEKRLPGTLAIHLKAYENGANIIRCHDVKEHIQAFKLWRAIDELKG